MVTIGAPFGPIGIAFAAINGFAIVFIGDIIGNHIENDLEADNKFGGKISFDDPMEDVTDTLKTGIMSYVPNPIERMVPRPIYFFFEQFLKIIFDHYPQN